MNLDEKITTIQTKEDPALDVTRRHYMNQKQILFGIKADTLIEGCLRVEAALGASLVVHESYYHGGEYFSLSQENFSIALKTNFVEDDGDHTEAAFPDAVLLLYVTGEETAVDHLSLMASREGFNLLRSRMY